MQYAFIYCRVSTEEQAEHGYSLDAQEKLCREFARRNEYEVRAVFRDEGKSGTKLERPALQDMLTRCQQEHSIGAIIIQETDRLARNTQDHLAIKAILRKAEVKLISVAQPMLDDSPEGMMIDTILASVNQFQSDINSRKTKKGMQEKFEEGWWPGCAPLGYLNVSADGDDSRRIVVKDPDRWHLLQEGFELYLSGAYSVEALRDILFERGLRTKGGKKLAHSLMARTLRNPFYAGQLRWRGQVGPGKHEPMITMIDHEHVLAIMAEHIYNGCRKRKHQFLLRGFVSCRQCGHRYTAEVHPKKGKAYYHCAGHGHSSAGQNVEVADLEQQVAEQFKTIQIDQKVIERMMTRLQRIAGEQREMAAAERRVLANRIQALEARRDQAEEKLLRGVLEDQAFTRIRDKLGQELMHLRSRLDMLAKDHSLDVNTLRTVVELLRNPYETYCRASAQLKRQYLAVFWDRIVVQDRRIVEARPSPIVRAVQAEEKVIITTTRGPSRSAIITMLESPYFTSVRTIVSDIQKLSATSALAA